jgi:hypothetical protein
VTNAPDIVAAIRPIVDLFDRIGVAYSVVGSVASSAHGIARATLDVDLVADLPGRLVHEVVSALHDAYYIDRDMAADAVQRKAMFNVVHLATMLKVDIYVLTDRPFDRESFRRRRALALEEEPSARSYQVDTPEDTVIHKLEWFRAGGDVSERQWGDLIGVIRVQGTALDIAYMRRWAGDLGVSDLLERALREASAASGGSPNVVAEFVSPDARWRATVRRRPDGMFQVHLEKWMDDPQELVWAEVPTATSFTDTLENARTLARELLIRHAPD